MTVDKVVITGMREVEARRVSTNSRRLLATYVEVRHTLGYPGIVAWLSRQKSGGSIDILTPALWLRKPVGHTAGYQGIFGRMMPKVPLPYR